MADTKLSNLPEISSLAPEDLIYVTDGMSKRIKKDFFEQTIKPDRAGNADNADKLGNVLATEYFLTNGSRPLTGNLNAGGMKVVGMAEGTNVADAVTLGQLNKQVPLDGSRIMTGNLLVGDGSSGGSVHVRGNGVDDPSIVLKGSGDLNIGKLGASDSNNDVVLDRFDTTGSTIVSELALKGNGELRYNDNEVMDESMFVSSSTGTAEAGKPIFLNGQGHIDPSMLDVGLFHYEGNFTPTSTAEYPDTTGQESGAFWSVEGLSAPYGFIGGDLAGQSVENGNFMVWSSGSWSIIVSSMDPTLYYKLDGSLSLTEDFAGGGFRLRNIADGVSNNDAATVGQLTASTGGETFLGIPVPSLVDKYPFKNYESGLNKIPRPVILGVSDDIYTAMISNDLSVVEIAHPTLTNYTMNPEDVNPAATIFANGLAWGTSQSTPTENKDVIVLAAVDPVAPAIWLAKFSFETGTIVQTKTFPTDSPEQYVGFAENFDGTYTVDLHASTSDQYNSFVYEIDENFNSVIYREISKWHGGRRRMKISDDYKYLGEIFVDPDISTIIGFGSLDQGEGSAYGPANGLNCVTTADFNGTTYLPMILGDYMIFVSSTFGIKAAWNKDDAISFFEAVYDVRGRLFHDNEV